MSAFGGKADITRTCADVCFSNRPGGVKRFQTAVILDAWSRRVVGYAFSRSIDARLAAAALKAAINARKPPRGCVHHSDRGSQYAPKSIAPSYEIMAS